MVDGKKARAKKEISKDRAAALAAVKNAKSDQERTVAKQKLKLVRFKEVASTRTDALLRALKNLENACDTTAYSWTDDQAAKIINAAGPIWKRIEEGLRKPAAKKATREKFSL